MKTKNIHLSPVVQIFKNEQGVAHQQVDGIYFAGQYRRLSFSSRKTKRTNLRAVNASARLCWHPTLRAWYDDMKERLLEDYYSGRGHIHVSLYYC